MAKLPTLVPHKFSGYMMYKYKKTFENEESSRDGSAKRTETSIVVIVE